MGLFDGLHEKLGMHEGGESISLPDEIAAVLAKVAMSVVVAEHHDPVDIMKLHMAGKKKIILKTGKVLCERAMKSGIPRIIFLDRSARNGSIIVSETWKRKYPNQIPPNLDTS